MAWSKNSKSCCIVSICENISLCEIFTKIHKHLDIKIFTSLAKVEQWDIYNKNEYENICNFECLVCLYKTSVFDEWKWHIVSILHMELCDKFENLYSSVCTNNRCIVLFYGPKAYYYHSSEKIHLESSLITHNVPILMAEVMKRFITIQKPLYYCSHCKKFEETPIIHTDTATNGVKNLIDFYCKFCRVTFFSSAEMIDYHSLSVEHLTLKYLYELCLTNKIHFVSSNQEENNKLIPNVFVSNSGLSNNMENIQLFQEPVVNNVSLEKNDNNSQHDTCESYNEENMELIPNLNFKLRNSENSISYHNVSIYEYSSYYEFFTKIHKDFNIITIITSLATVKPQWDIIDDTHFKTICNFECLVCFYKTSVFDNWKWHILSIQHLEKSNKFEDLYSYVCTSKGCKVMLYGPQTSLCEHRMKKHLHNGIIQTGISILMAKVMKHFITTQKPLYYCSGCKKIKETPIHTDTATNYCVTYPIDFYCKFCRVTFLSSADTINSHSLSVEHMTLKYLHEFCSTNKILCVPSNQKETNKLFSSASVSNSELLNNLENIQLFQEPVVYNNSLKKNDDDRQKNISNSYNEEIMELIPNLKCQNLNNKDGKNNDILLYKKQNDNEKETLMTNSFSSLDKNSSQIKHNSDTVTISNLVKPPIISMNTILPTETYQPNVDEIIKTNNLDTNKKLQEEIAHEENKAYGEYVAQRLQYIYDNTVKQNIKLEIDFLFYQKIKQLSQKNIK